MDEYEVLVNAYLLAKEMTRSFRNFEVITRVPTLIEEAIDISSRI